MSYFRERPVIHDKLLSFAAIERDLGLDPLALDPMCRRLANHRVLPTGEKEMWLTDIAHAARQPFKVLALRLAKAELDRAMAG